MNIVHVSTPLSWRGGEQQLGYLAGELAKRNIAQIVICPQGSKLQDYCLKNALPHKTYKNKGLLKIKLAFFIFKVCKSLENPIIHTHDSHAHTAAFMQAAFLFSKVPIVVSRRVDFAVKNSVFSKWKYNHPAIKRIICVSDTIRELTLPAVKRKTQVITVHSGIDKSRFENVINTNFLKSTYKLNSSHILVGNTSALAEHKDYYTFIDTATETVLKNSKFRFFIIGNGPLSRQIEDYIIERGMQDYIFMTGFLQNIPEILMELHIFLITSVTEGLGTSILDAFASKLPVVATNAGGIPEMIEHKKTGMLANIKDSVALSNHLMEISMDNNLKNEIIANALIKLEFFTKETTALKTIEVYKELTSNSSRMIGKTK